MQLATDTITQVALNGPLANQDGAVAPARNIYACLVHDQPDCIVDLVRNLRHHDPVSPILLYNGGAKPDLLSGDRPWKHYGALVHPAPQRMRWGRLHDFALDCMRFALENVTFDTLTIVDSDQLAMRDGYCAELGRSLAAHPRLGILGDVMGPHHRRATSPPAQRMWREFALWEPLLRRFPIADDAWLHTLFWPATVFTTPAARALCTFWDQDAQLRDIMAKTRVWPTEELVLPVLVGLLGFEVRRSPFSNTYVKFRRRYTPGQVDTALRQPNVFWMHPVPRQLDNPVRAALREAWNHYGERTMEPPTAPAPPPYNGRPLLLTTELLRRMRGIEGWLGEDEADLLIAALSRVLTDQPGPHAVVEVGSYCGRSTVVLGSVVQALAPKSRVYAVDPHDGVVGAADRGLQNRGPTLAAFKRNLAAAGLTDQVEIVQQVSADVAWHQPISLLLIDRLHDYANVARDFRQFEPWLVQGGFVAFHDYARYYPGVMRFVDELLRQPGYRKVMLRETMMLIERVAPAEEHASAHRRVAKGVAAAAMLLGAD